MCALMKSKARKATEERMKMRGKVEKKIGRPCLNVHKAN